MSCPIHHLQTTLKVKTLNHVLPWLRSIPNDGTDPLSYIQRYEGWLKHLKTLVRVGMVFTAMLTRIHEFKTRLSTHVLSIIRKDMKKLLN